MTRDEALKQLDEWFESNERCVPIEAVRVAHNSLKASHPYTEVDDNFEPWLPNSRNQRCVLPLINLLLNE